VKRDSEKAYYGFGEVNYVTFAATGFGIAGILLGTVFAILTYPIWISILCWSLGAILLIAGLLWHLFMGFAGNPKKVEQVRQSFLGELDAIWDGREKVLDIGTGSGRAAIGIASQFPEAQSVGLDMWSKKWRFFGVSREQAERNAELEGVSDRCTFQQGDALNMPFEDGEFQLVVSSLVFHEIGIPDRIELFREAIRVLEPGSIFMICDTFRPLDGYKVKTVPELLEKIEKLGVQEVKFKTLKETGVDLGGFAHIWGISYISGKKVRNE